MKLFQSPWTGPQCACIATGMLAMFFIILCMGYDHPVSAHAEHEKKNAREWDPDEPRVLSPETAKHIGLKTETVATRCISEILELSGKVKTLPDNDWRVAPRLPGRIISINKRRGAAVVKGDLLVSLECPDMAKNILDARKFEAEYLKLNLETERNKIEAEVMKATLRVTELQAQYAQNELNRFQALNAVSPTAESELANRREAAERMAADVRINQMQLAQYERSVANLTLQSKAAAECARISLSFNGATGSPTSSEAPHLLELRAEFEGIVAERFAGPGEWVQAGQTLLEIVNLSSVQIEVEVPESLIDKVVQRKSDKVRIDVPAAPARSIEGKAGPLCPKVHPVKRTATLIIDAPNPDGILRDDLWVSLALELSVHEKTLAVPKSAVVTDGPEHFVFVESGEAFEKQDIVPGISDDRYVEVKKGLAPGDIVVSQGACSIAQLRPKSHRSKK